MLTTRHAKRTYAFTLVELLVVVAIISLLTALLLPVLNKARDSARSVLCQSQLRQSAVGMFIYADEYKQTIPVFRRRGGNIRLWTYFLVHGMSTKDQPFAAFGEYVPRTVSLCPSNEHYKKDVGRTDTSSTATTNLGYAAYVPMHQEVKTYKLNHIKSDSYTTSGGTKVSMNLHRLDQVGHPGSAILLADSASMHNSHFKATGRMIANFRIDGSSNWSGRIHVIHGGKANVLAYDGHTMTGSPEELRDNTTTRPRAFYAENLSYLPILDK